MIPSMPLVAAAGPVPLDLAALLGVLVAAWIAGRLAQRVGMPAVLGELLAGVILGPPMLGLLGAGDGLDVVAELGILLMMLAIGLHVDLDDVLQAKGPGILAAVGGFLVPAAAGTAVLMVFGYDLLAALFVGLALGVTSLATKSRILADLDLFGTRIAHVLVAGALLSDTAILVAFAAIMGFVQLGGFDLAGTALVAVEVVAFLAFATAAGRIALPRLAAVIKERGWDTTTANLTIVLGVGLAYGLAAEVAGLHALLGTFLAGMFLRAAGFAGTAWRAATELVDGVTMRLLAPVFFVTAGFAISFDAVVDAPWLLLAVFAAASLGKIIGTAVFYLPSGHGLREGLVVGAGMNGRGAVEIIVAGIGLEAGVIDLTLFTVLVFTAIATTATVPALLTWGVRWLRASGDLPEAPDRSGVLIIGGGPVGRLLGSHLADRRPVTVLDANAAHTAAAVDAGLSAVTGDALDEETLADANAGTAETVVALTSNPEVNVLAARRAHDIFNVEHAVAAVGSRFDGLRKMATEHDIRPLTAAPADVEEWDHLVAAGRATARWHEVTESTDELTAGSHLPLLVERDGDLLVHATAIPLQPGDRVLTLADDREHTRVMASSASA